MKTAVIVFPGSNCDHDSYHAMKHVLDVPTTFVWHEDSLPDGYDLVILPGGFSYGDYLRAGAIARFSPVMKSLVAHVKRGGYLLGICNGFQVLTEARLLPGALTRNRSMKFICRDVSLLVENSDSFVTSQLKPKSVITVPVAHMEGCYVADDATLDKLDAEDRILFRYCDAAGNITDAANPNGSARNIAGILSANGRVVGMMPHPERVCEPELGGIDGLAIFNSALATF